MRIGSLRRRLDIVFETVVGSESEGAFEAKKVWMEWRSGVPCSVSVRRGQEHFMQIGEGGQRFSKDIYYFTVRYRSVDGIDPTMKVRYDGLLYDIRHIRPDAQMKREVTLECEVQDFALGSPPLIPSVLDFIPEGTVGVAYGGFTVSAEGGVTPYVFAEDSAGLPPGLIINSSTGLISGTPTTQGIWPCEVFVSDADGTMRSLTFSIKINAAPIP